MVFVTYMSRDCFLNKPWYMYGVHRLVQHQASHPIPVGRGQSVDTKLYNYLMKVHS